MIPHVHTLPNQYVSSLNAKSDLEQVTSTESDQPETDLTLNINNDQSHLRKYLRMKEQFNLQKKVKTHMADCIRILSPPTISCREHNTHELIEIN